MRLLVEGRYECALRSVVQVVSRMAFPDSHLSLRLLELLLLMLSPLLMPTASLVWYLIAESLFLTKYATSLCAAIIIFCRHRFLVLFERLLHQCPAHHRGLRPGLLRRLLAIPVARASLLARRRHRGHLLGRPPLIFFVCIY